MENRSLTWGSALLPMMLAGAAIAQVPAGIQPGQSERGQQTLREPAAPIEITAPAASVQEAPANAASVKLVLRQLDIEGVTAYPPNALQGIYQGDLGKEITLARVYAIAAELTARYRNDGYILSQVVVPAQSVKDGRVTLRAVEGYIHTINIQGNAAAMDLVKTYAESIKTAKPLTAAALERYLLLMNDIPGVVARSTIAASSTPGAADLTLAVSQREKGLSAGLNNRNTKLLGPWRGNLDASFIGLGGADQIGLRGVHTLADRELASGTLSYDRILNDQGLKLSVSHSSEVSRPQATEALPTLHSKSQTSSLGLNYPLVRSRLQNLSLRGTFAHHNGATDADGVQILRDRVRAIRVGASYDRVDAYRGINLVELDVSHGLSGMGASAENDPLVSRAGASPNFRKMTLYAARLQSLAPKWSLLTAFSGQAASGRLLTPEQFTFGGADFGRGYDASDLTGDSGAAFKLELRFSSKGVGIIRDYTAYAFYDAGWVRQEIDSAMPRSDHASSSGLGLRFTGNGGVSGFVEFGKPRNHDVAANTNRKGRVFAGLSVAF